MKFFPLQHRNSILKSLDLQEKQWALVTEANVSFKDVYWTENILLRNVSFILLSVAIMRSK